MLHHQDGLTRVEPCVPIGERQLELLSQARALCEACRTVRPRNQTFIMRERASGRTVQVGSSCLRPYTGVDSAAEPIRRAQTMAAATRAVSAAARNAASPARNTSTRSRSSRMRSTRSAATASARTGPRQPRGGRTQARRARGAPSIGDLRRAAEIRQWAALIGAEGAGRVSSAVGRQPGS